MRSATRHLLHEIVLWTSAALVVGAVVYFFEDLREAVAPGSDPFASIAEATSSGARDDADAPSGFSGEVRLKADRLGHFVFEGAIDDRPITFMADTGASFVALTYEDAKRVGLSPHSLDFSARVQTANGVARVAPVMLDRVRVKDITVRDVPAAVAEEGALATNLLGMSFLRRLQSFQIQGNELVLVQ